MIKLKNQGFTLVELLVVIAIIGILSTLAVVSLNSARIKSRDAKRVSDLKQISTALEFYNNDKKGYPVVAAAISLGEAGATTFSTGAGFSDTPSDTTLMGLVPKDPQAPTNHYDYTGTATTFQIKTALEGKIEDFTGDICATQDGLKACPQ